MVLCLVTLADLSPHCTILFPDRDVTRLGLGGGAQAPPPQRMSQPPQTGTVIGLFLHGCFGHYAAVG